MLAKVIVGGRETSPCSYCLARSKGQPDQALVIISMVVSIMKKKSRG